MSEINPNPENLSDADQLWVCSTPDSLAWGCGSELVTPIEWVEEKPRHCRILLHCPECESQREGIFTQKQAEALDDELDRAEAQLEKDLLEVGNKNMREEGEFFIRALNAGIIQADDFKDEPYIVPERNS